MRWPDSPLSDGELTLRAPRPQDAEAVTPLLRDPEIPRWTHVPEGYTPALWHEWMARSAQEQEQGRGVSFLVVDGAGAILGSVGLQNVQGGTAQIGYWVAAHARGRRVAPRAVRLVTDWAHGTLGLRRVELLAHAENRPSQRVAERAGYADTGERRPAPAGVVAGTYLVFASER